MTHDLTEWATELNFTKGASVLDQIDEPTPIWGTPGESSLWVEGEGLYVIGPIGGGKTTVIQDVIRAGLGIGERSVLGVPVDFGSRRVLYIAADRPRQIKRAFRRLVDEEHREILNDRLVWLEGHQMFINADPYCIVKACEESDTTLVVIDSLKDVTSSLKGDEDGIVINRAHQLAIGEGIDLIGNHHLRKDVNSKIKLDDFYGSVFIPAGLGSVLALEGRPGGSQRLHQLKTPYGDEFTTGVFIDVISGAVRLPGSDLLVLIEMLQPTTYIDLAKHMFKLTGRPKSNSTEVTKVRRLVERLASDGLVNTEPSSNPSNPLQISLALRMKG